MSGHDFDLQSLAKYLHLTAAQVNRLADRGKLPGRKIAGQWRFAQADIHHWLEERIGLSDEEGLTHVESVLQRGAEFTPQAAPSIGDLLPVQAIAVPLDARTRGSVISSMTTLAAGTGLLWDAAKMADAVRARESLHPTALDNGVALLHPRRPMPSILAEAFLALGITRQGIPFGGDRHGLTDIFFLICSTNDQGHLQVLARLSRLISDPALLSEIRAADNAQDVYDAIRDADSKLQS